MRNTEKNDIMRRIIRNLIKRMLRLALLFVLSVLLVNLVRPALHAELGADEREAISQLEFESDSVGAERVICIDDNDEALLWRLRMIGSARERLVLASFDLRPDESGTAVMASLFAAAERGVRVQILVDGLYQVLFLRNDAAFRSLCAHENVEARFYNPVALKNSYRVNYRMHDKYILADDSMYLLGGRNTSDTFLGTPQEGANIDRDLLVYHTAPGKGESFRRLEEYFLQVWDEPCVEAADERIGQEEISAAHERFRSTYQELLGRYGAFEAYDGWEQAGYETNRITLLTNGTHAGNKEPRVLYALGWLAQNRREVLIQTPYVICDQAMYDALRDMGERAKVQIFLNAVTRGSNPWGCTDYLNNKGKLLDTGADVYELMNEYAVHTKAVLLDDRLTVAGSYNFDMRSTYLDTELMLVVDSKPLNAHIRQTLEEYREKSVEVRSDGTETVGERYEERELTAGKQVFYGVLRVLIRPFRHLL